MERDWMERNRPDGKRMNGDWTGRDRLEINRAGRDRTQRGPMAKERIDRDRMEQDLLNGAREYLPYRMSGGEMGKAMVLFALLGGMISYLFYRSPIAFAALLPAFALFYREYRNTLQRRQQRQMQAQFLAAMQFVCNALQAGYAIENAFREAHSQLIRVYDSKSFIILELQRINARVRLNVPMEALLTDLGRRTGLEDVIYFAEVFEVARKSGGDLIAIVRHTISQIQQKEETGREIDTMLSGKKMEQLLMSIIPMLILLYVGLTSPDFLEGMYHTAVGTVVMSIALVVYIISFLWGRKLMDIRI